MPAVTDAPSPPKIALDERQLAYTIKKLSEATGASESAIYLDIRTGVLPSFIIGKRHIISRQAAEAWLEARAGGKKTQRNARWSEKDWQRRGKNKARAT